MKKISFCVIFFLLTFTACRPDGPYNTYSIVDAFNNVTFIIEFEVKKTPYLSGNLVFQTNLTIEGIESFINSDHLNTSYIYQNDEDIKFIVITKFKGESTYFFIGQSSEDSFYVTPGGIRVSSQIVWFPNHIISDLNYIDDTIIEIKTHENFLYLYNMYLNTRYEIIEYSFEVQEFEIMIDNGNSLRISFSFISDNIFNKIIIENRK